ncbi:hypothetical protein PHLCEN_2v11645 [Hermanssonia centrifuga]|uniref:Uncharacterized protein n=1 Tax=Hermanssonia centrifuga TaxID=98765 RepID=A0A2R6NJB8_9APHY|nr:hypothetical protein PHLCEN_2v11645 [Hermanssonia centrifuga]
MPPPYPINRSPRPSVKTIRPTVPASPPSTVQCLQVSQGIDPMAEKAGYTTPFVFPVSVVTAFSATSQDLPSTPTLTMLVPMATPFLPMKPRLTKRPIT